MRPTSWITPTNSTADSGATRYSIATTIGPDVGWTSRLGGVSAARARGSSDPSCSTEIGNQRAASSDSSDATPATVRALRRPTTLAYSPHHHAPNAMPANATVWYVASMRPVTQRGDDSCTAMLRFANDSVQ